LSDQRLPGCHRIRTSFEPTNAVAEALYESLGVRKGLIDQGEVVMLLKVPGRE
jgi:predicted RNA-binding protein with PUA domain